MVKSTKSVYQDDGQCFFKIINKPQIEDLRIPPSFKNHILNDGWLQSHTATLKGPSGSHWDVKLCRKGGELYLRDGWQQFMRDHSLGTYEFVLFRYEGGMHFNVTIFDQNGMERVDPSLTWKQEADRGTSASVSSVELKSDYLFDVQVEFRGDSTQFTNTRN